MTDQVESLEVEFQDGVSANAKKATDSIHGLGDAAVAAEAKTQRAGKGIKKATDEAAAGAAAAAKAMDGAGKATGGMAGEIERATEKVARHSQTAEQLANKFDRAKREAGAVAKAIAPYQRALDDLEKSSASAAEKEALRATITAKMEAATEKARAAVARYFKDVEAGAAAATASAGGMDAGMRAATASANSWAGGLGKVYESANSAAGGLNAAARALAGLNAGLESGHTSFAEWTAGARGLEANLRGVSAAQKAINDATGISRQTVNTATIGPLKHAVTGTAAPTGNTLGLVTGDASATAARLADLEAAFGEADKALDGYRASLGLVDVAQQRYEAGLDELQRTIRLAGVEKVEGARLLAAYAAAHDPAIKKAKDLATAQATAAKETEQAERAALAKMSADWDAAVREREADAAMIIAAERDAAAAVKQEETALRSLVGTLDRTFDAEERLTAQQRLLDRAHRDGVGGIKLSEDQHKALSAALKEQHDLATRSATSTKLAAHESLNLGYQLQDFVVQVGSGQGVITPLLQQAPQAVGAVGGVGRAVALMTSPIALATMGTLALGGAMAVVIARAVEVSAHTRRLSVDIQAMGNASGVSAGQLRAIETQLRQQGVSGDAAFAAARTLAGARGLPASMLGDVASIGRNMAAGTDDVAESVKGLTDALSEGYAGIRKLDDQYNFLTVDERRQIETMARHGDQAGVLKTAIDALHRQFDGLHEKALSPAGAAMERLSAGYNRLLDSIASRPIVIKGLEALALLLDKTAGSIGEPTKAERIAGIRRELSDLDAQYSRLPEATSGIQANHEAIILRRIDLMQQLAKLEKESAANQSSQIRTGAPRTAGTSNARSGMPDPAAAKYVSEQAAAFEHLSEAMQGNAIQRTLAQADMRAEEEIRDRRLRGLAADEIRTIRHKEALLQLTVAVGDSNRAAAADVAGNELVARAYGVSSAAVRETTLHQKAMAEAARGTIEPYDAIVARLRAVDDAQRAVQAAQYDQTLRQQAEDAERLASAWARGAGAAREAALANEVLAEARKRGLDPERDAGEIGNIGAGVWARDQAQRTQQFAQMASEQRRAVDLANAEFGMLGASNAERAKMVAMLQAANDLRDKGADLTDAGTRAYIEQAGELARVNSQLQDAAQNAANITQPITTGLEDIIVGAKGAGDAVKALGEDLKRIAARQLITKPFETAVSGALTRLMSGGVSIANDNRPTPANDPGGLDRLITTVKGGLGSSSSNPMWVTMASGSAAFDIGAMASASPMPVAIKDAGGLEGIIQGAATKYGVDPAIIKGIIERESSWRADAVNKTSGAAGLMQLMPANVRAYGVSNAFDPAQNIETGTRILKEHLVRAGGDIDKALSTYSGHITKDGSAYVSAVKASAEGYRQAGAGLRLVVDNTQGVTAAQESQLQAMLDAVPVQRAATSGAQNLTAAQDSLIASVLGTSKANDAALQVVDLQTRSISALGANAISVAEGLGDAADGASSLADASESSSNILLRGAQAVYSGFTGVLGSLWNSVSGLFGGVSAGGGGAVGAASTTQASLLGGGFGNVSSALSLANSGYSIYTGANTLGTTVANFATSTTGQSLGLATSAVGPTGPVIPQLTGAGEALTGVAGTIGSALPYGAVGGFLGGLAGTAMNSKAGGAAVGAVTGAGSAALGSYLMTGSMMGPWGLAAAAIIGGVMAALGTTKASVGPNAQGHILYEDGRYVQGPSAADNGGDDGNVKTVTASLATGFNALADAYGLTLKARNYGYWEGGTDKATGIGVHNDPEELIRQILRDATATDPTSNVAKALANETVRNSGDLEEIQKYLDVAKKIDSATEAFTELNKSLTQVQANAKAAAAENWKAIDEEIKTADKIGLGSEYRKSLENSIRSSFEGAVQAATPWETAMATLRGETEAWIEAVTRWNVGVSEAEIRADAAAKAAKLQAQAVAEYTASLYDAQGRDYLTSLSGIEDARDTTRRNLTAVGVDDAAGRANTLVTSQFTSVLSGLDLAQLTDVTRTLGGEVGALAETMRVAAQAVVTEDLTVRALRAQGKAADADAMELRLKQEREYRQAEKDGYDAASLAGLRWLQGLEAQTAATERAAQAAAYNADVTSRMYAAVGANRISGLLSLDQQQAVELAQARDAGYDTTRLQEVQAAERGQKAFDLAKADVLEWYDREIAAKQELVTSLQDGALKVSQAAKQFKAAGDSIRLSEDAPISPQERLAEAKRQWDAALGTINSSTASDGEKDTARSALASLGQTLVSIEKTNSAGTARALFDEVLGVLDRLGDPATYGAGTATAEADLKVAQDQLKEMQRARTEAANLGQRQLGSLDSIVSIMNQSYSLWQASLVPANQNTGTPTSATLDQMLKGLTKDTLGGIIEWAKAQGPETYQKALVAADTRLGWENNSYRYAAPADVATMDGTGFGINDALGFLKQFGYTGQFDSNANAFIQSHGLADAYTSFLRDFKARNSLEGKRARLEAFSAAQIEAAFGGMPDIQAARLADPAFDLAQWFRQTGINEVLAGQRQIPGFATGTLSTPPGAVWVGERGPELMWQAGGAAVASSADSLRIAGIYASAVNDRWSATNVSDFRPAAPARPERGNGRDAAILAELRRLNDQIAELRKGVHAEEGSAQNQRGVLLTKLIKTVEALQAELAEQKPRLTA